MLSRWYIGPPGDLLPVISNGRWKKNPTCRRLMSSCLSSSSPVSFCVERFSVTTLLLLLTAARLRNVYRSEIKCKDSPRSQADKGRDGVDTRSQRYSQVRALKARRARRVAVCLYKWLSGCLMEALFLFLFFFVETLRNECPAGSSRLLRCWVIVGVLKSFQTMSASETRVMYESAKHIFKSICPRNPHF